MSSKNTPINAAGMDETTTLVRNKILSFLNRSLNIFFLKKIKIAKDVPKWKAVKKNEDVGISKNFESIMIWPLLETGSNSVNP